MCTLTYLPNGDDMAVVSSRDEASSRGGMRAPLFDQERNAYYPLDELSGGTWFYHAPLHYTAVLLNGGHVAHERILPYRHSRGLVSFHLAAFTSVDEFVSAYDFQQLEPFTLVVIDEEPRRVRSIVWTGSQVDQVDIDPDHPHIWSSATLYDGAATARRAEWFRDALMEPFEGSAMDRLMHFHEHGGSQWPDAGERILMQRGADLGTVCHVGLDRRAGRSRMYYHDLVKNEAKWKTIPK